MSGTVTAGGTVRFKFLTTALVGVCFGALGWLNGRDGFGRQREALLFAAAGLVLLLLFVLALALANRLAGAGPPESRAFGAAWGAVAHGCLIVLPLTALAFLAEFVFDWQAAAAFIQASFMVSAAGAGTEVMKLGRPRARHLAVSMVVGVVFSAAWTVLVAYFPWDLFDGVTL